MTNSSFNNAFALLIGASGPGEEYMADDVHALSEVLTDKNYGGYPKKNVVTLTDKKATRANILKAFDDLSKKLNKDSNVFLYYSGHGEEVYDADQNEYWYYLKLHGITNENQSTHRVLAKELKAKINGMVADRLIFFFDCCHAQGLTKGDGIVSIADKLEERITTTLNTPSQEAKPEGMLQNIDDEEGIAIISSCKDEQKSWKFKDEKNSIFTTCLLEVLKGEHKSHFEDPFIRITDVLDYLFKEVPKRALEIDQKQVPFANIQFDNNFELSQVPKQKLSLKGTTNTRTLQPVKKQKKHTIKKVFYKSPGANNAIIFVHGFSGEAHKTFGKIPDFLYDDDRMDAWDMYPFGFNQNVNPQMGNAVYATVQDIRRIADNLSSAIKHKFGDYKRIAIIAHSLGGLVAQRAILNLDSTQRERLSHVLLFGTPSNGITNNAVKKLWKNKIGDLIQGQPFIKNLRDDWSKTFKEGYPFTFKVVAATKDMYVPKDSSLEPFNKAHWIKIGGDHLNMVNASSKENDAYELIINTLTDHPFFTAYTNEEEVNIAMGEYSEVIRKLKPALPYLNESGLEKLIYAMECSGLRDEAIAILESHPIAQNDADMLQVLGDLFKNEYLNNSHVEDGNAAYNCFKRALRIAKKNKEVKQVYLNAINLAFLNLMLEGDERDMKSYALLAKETASKIRRNSAAKLATIAEANLYLNDLDQAMSAYIKTAKKADVREKILIHNQAFTAYTALHGHTDTDAFIKFLEFNFLS